MPTPRLRQETIDQMRLDELEDRRYAEAREAARRDHELLVLDRKQAHSKQLAVIRSHGLNKGRKTVVWAVTILALFGRPVPKVLENLLDS